MEAPATSGNFGPGFDVFSLALARRGDRVRVTEADADEVRVTGVGADDVPAKFDGNCAAVAVDHLRRVVDLDQPLRVDLEKGVPPGSGLGSSASSSAAGALAFYHAYRDEFRITQRMLLDAAAAGERAAGGDHRDDVSAALFGGLAVVPPGDGLPFRLDPPLDMHLAFALPDVRLETRRMRSVLPAEVPQRDVVFNLYQVARMVDAVHQGDVVGIGRALEDRVHVPYRAPLVPGYRDARNAALDVGAFGFALSGSGPACFAVTDSEDLARTVVEAMTAAFKEADVNADGFIAGAAYGGVDDAAVDVH